MKGQRRGGVDTQWNITQPQKKNGILQFAIWIDVENTTVSKKASQQYMWNLRNKTNEERKKKKREREKQARKNRELTTENKLMVTRG